MQILRRICAKIERNSIPGVNWIRTLYFNFRLLPFKQAVKLPVFIYGKPVFNSLSGRIIFTCPIKRGMVKMNIVKPFAPSLQTINSQMNICGTIVFGGNAMIGCGTKILVTQNAILELGDSVRITDFCNVDCCKHIVVNDGTSIAHRCQIMDSNHHYVLDTNSNRIAINSQPIHIGRQCWVCNSSTLTSGAKLPDYTIVASNSLVNKNFIPEGENIIIGGMPAKLIKKGAFRIFDDDVEIMLNEYFGQSEEKFYMVEPGSFDQYRKLKRSEM